MHCKPYLSVRPRSLRSLALLLTALSPCLFPAQRAAAQAAPVKTFYVNSTVDGTDAQPGDGICTTGQTTPGGAPQCTLRAAIDEANSDSGANTPYAVFVPAGTYFLTVSEACRVNGFASNGIPLCVSGNVQILGAAQSTVMLDSGQQDSVMIVTSTATAFLSHLTIQHGKNMYIGGGILDNGSLTVQNVTFNSNTYDDGSAIQNIDGSLLTIVGCTFTNNAGTVIQFHGGGTDSVSIDTSYFANNTASNAAVFEVLGTNNNAPGPLIISNSTIVNNTASADYLIYAGALTMTNTTVTGNTIGNSTLISAATTIFNNVTISNNTGKPYVDTSGLTLSNSIIDSGNGQPDLCGPLTDLGHNIIGNLGCSTGSVSSTTQIGVDPMLSMLEIDGGSVPTMTPLTGSPALAGGSTASPGGNASGACTALDENGSPRGVSAICSIGAAEPLRGLQLNHITPTVGGAGGNITMVLTGSGFDPATTVALHRSGQTDLAPQAALVSQDATAISAGFSLTGVALGSYDVVITTSTGSITLPASFNVAAPTSNVVQSYLSGPSRIRPGRPATFTVTYTNPGNDDAYLVPLYLGLPPGYTGGIKGLKTPPINSQQVLTDFTSSSLGVVPPNPADIAVLPILLPVVPAGSQNLLTFTVVSNGTEGGSFFVYQHISTPYSTNPDSGSASTAALNALVSGAVFDDTMNLGVTPSASAQAAMSTYANTQFNAIVAAGETAQLQSFGAAPVEFSIAQLLDDVGAYGAAYKSGQPGMVTRPFYLPSFSHNPTPGNCDGTPLPPGGSCNAPFAPYPGHSPYDPCSSNSLLQFAGFQNQDCPPDGPGGGGDLVGSVDPNLKTGPVGVGAAHYTQANTPFPYLIEFENTATASAPAQTVSVTDTLDTTTLDLSTFQLGPISFGSTPFVLNPPPGVTSFQGSIDLRPVNNIIVDVTVSLNKSTGVVTWNFLSLDPATMQLTTDPTAGFLPPDTTPPAGIGHVAFTINPLSSVADAATICNTATVVFDTNAPINTAQFCNTKDVSAPVSMVQALAAPQTTTAFPVTWSGTDAGSGIGTFTIYSNLDGGAFAPWLTATTATTGTFTGIAGHTYGFYSIATDLAGNVESAKTQAEASTYIGVAAGSFSPGSIAFPATVMGQTATMTVTLTSNGAMPLSVTGFTLSDATDFAESDTCVSASPLAVGASCTITLTFSPSTSTSLTTAPAGTLSVTSNAGTPPTPVTLSGTVDLPQAVWLVYANSTLGRFANSGTNATPAAGLAGGGSGIAIDQAGNVWSGTLNGTSIAEFSKSGSLLNTFSGGGISSPTSLAISGSGYVWIANANNTLSLLQPNGAAVSSSSGISGQPLSSPSGIAIDGAGSVWVSNAGDSSLVQFLGAADPVVTPLVKAVTAGTLGATP